MIPNQWYAVLSSHVLKKGQILGARRFSKDLVFFRSGSGNVSIMTSLCAHRGASLAKGCLTDGNIACPFHGIQYDLKGKCVHIPSEGLSSKQDFSRFNLIYYPSREIGGIIFAWYGDKEPDHEPDYFKVITDSSYTYDHTEDTWKVQYSRVIENQLDVSHLAFVHHNTIGRGNKKVCNGPKVVWLDDNTMQTSANNEVDIGQTPKSADESMIKDTNLTFKFPNMWLNHVTDKILILAFFIPVDDENSIIALRFYNKITGIRAIDKMIAWLGSRANRIVEKQDKRIVETQLPKVTGTRMTEMLVAADLPIVEYRSKRKELQDKANGKANIKANDKPKEKANSEDPNSNSMTSTFSKGGTAMPLMNTKAMYKLSYGLFVCTAVRGDKMNGCITNTAVQVASEPNRISIAINKANFTHDMIKESGACNISVISKGAKFELFKHFGFQSGREVDKFAPDAIDALSKALEEGKQTKIYETADNGIPYITAGTNAYFSLKVDKEVDLGSHTLFICEPTFMTVLSDTPSCTYEYYQSDIKPKPQPIGTTPKGETVWKCLICGYEYVGEDLPDDFICPICKHGKDDFEKIIK